jgi:hypothetical protein
MLKPQSIQKWQSTYNSDQGYKRTPKNPWAKSTKEDHFVNLLALMKLSKTTKAQNTI